MGDLKSNDNILYFKWGCLLLDLFFNHLSTVIFLIKRGNTA